MMMHGVELWPAVSDLVFVASCAAVLVATIRRDPFRARAGAVCATTAVVVALAAARAIPDQPFVVGIALLVALTGAFVILKAPLRQVGVRVLLYSGLLGLTASRLILAAFEAVFEQSRISRGEVCFEDPDGLVNGLLTDVALCAVIPLSLLFGVWLRRHQRIKGTSGKALVTMMTFTFVGPICGLALVYPIFALPYAIHSPTAAGSTLLLLATPVPAMFAYMVGVVPAFMTGAVAVSTSQWSVPKRLAAIVSTGAITSSVVGFRPLIAHAHGRHSMLWSPVPALLGAYSALVCSLIVIPGTYRQLRGLLRNSSTTDLTF